MQFCPKCDNLLDISKGVSTTTMTVLDERTPVTVTGEDEEVKTATETVNAREAFFETLINKIIDDTIKLHELKDVSIEQILRSKAFTSLNKKIKASVKTKLMTMYETINNAASAYYYCDNCNYNIPIEPGTKVLTKTGMNTKSSYINMNRMKNLVHSKISGFTNDFTCPNNECLSHNDPDIKEAIIYRLHGSLQAWYSCMTCKTTWHA